MDNKFLNEIMMKRKSYQAIEKYKDKNYSKCYNEKISNLIKEENIEELREIVKRDNTPLGGIYTYTNVLDDAIKSKNIEIVTLIIEAGCCINNQYCKYSLYTAIKCSTLEIFKYLVKSGMNVYIEDDESCLLLYSMELGNEEMARYLISIGLSPYKLNKYENNALMAAIHSKMSLDFIKYLIELGVDPNFQNWNGLSVLNIAFYQEVEDVIRLLIENDVKVDQNVFNYACAKSNIECLSIIISREEIDVNEGIIISLINEREDIFFFLIENGANIDNELVLTLEELNSLDIQFLETVIRIFKNFTVNEEDKFGLSKNYKFYSEWKSNQ